MSEGSKAWNTLWHSCRRRRYFYVCIMVTVLVAIAQPLLVGRIYSETQAIALLESLKSSSLYFGSAIATASATVLALMLTLLSMTNRSDAQFDKSVYSGIRLIGLISTITFITAVVLLLFLSLPVGEFEKIPAGWFRSLYYVLSTINGCLTGLIIMGVLMLSETINTLIRQISP